MKPYEMPPVWEHNTAVDRINTCIAMLHVHGFMTDAEKIRVTDRVQKWRSAENKKR